MSRKVVFLALAVSGAFACASKILPTDDQWVASQAGARPAQSASAPENSEAKPRPEPDDVKACKRLLARDDTRAAAADLALRAH